MERHQPGQDEKLVEVRMEMDSLEVIHPPRVVLAHRCGSVKFVIALIVMGLITVALMVAFLCQYFIFMPTYSQESPPFCGTTKVNISCKLKESEEKGRYDIFTAKKGAKYFIYGWVKLSDIISEEVILRNMFNQDSMSIEKKHSKPVIFFFEEIKLVNNARISIYFNSYCADSLFHIYEL